MVNCRVRRLSNMPVRLLSSSVLTWPDAQAVKKAVGHWADKTVKSRKDLLRIGYFGSYARGDWGVGSDLDLIVIIKSSNQPFVRRASEWDVTTLPVPADLLVYTEEEWQTLSQQTYFYQRLMSEIVWVYVSTG
jgi:predicted nucleotidyltransferase